MKIDSDHESLRILRDVRCGSGGLTPSEVGLYAGRQLQIGGRRSYARYERSEMKKSN